MLRRPPACPAGVIDDDEEFLLKITFPVIHIDKLLTSCGFRVYFVYIITEIINEIRGEFSALDLAIPHSLLTLTGGATDKNERSDRRRHDEFEPTIKIDETARTQSLSATVE